MPLIHFLNVKDRDCSIIEHASGNITVIDVCNARRVTDSVLQQERNLRLGAAAEKGLNGNYNQKAYPVNPIVYMKERGLTNVFRFILTHPDMDHMDGIKAFFESFSPLNFWDTDNAETKVFGEGNNRGYDELDWDFYRSLRDSKPDTNPRRLRLYSGAKGKYYNVTEDGQAGGDGLNILAPTSELVSAANESEDFNDCSYVILYQASNNHRILFAGDSHNRTWEHVLMKHESSVKNVDLLVAPHHGRNSDRDWEFLDVVRPTLTLLGNAKSENLAYTAWSSRGLRYITNNQAGCVLVDVGVGVGVEPISVYVTCEAFARSALTSSSIAKPPYTDYRYYGTVRRSLAYRASLSSSR